ncbi:c-type cytochrome [Dactylosporangium aurantiacum]|uniref:C-type cytochrome n=1 Tax=Dactylosporangium aurantiacum TaxID=35754 RepID=A0A9Q9IRL5_9ACTN|nr:c-type cytochrome [Dactylosporangium aurantiacum]MDG6110198.1 c-type cytochrome [Dactylosporangium aurantiacum]UWZ58655.1 c-type cytochrome [Dactylosporangium aurantiacum]
MRWQHLRGLVPAVATVALLGLPAACSTLPSPPPVEVHDGDPARGARLISQYGCGSCHTVPGVRGADGLVGPPLTRFGSRSYIAGELVNNGPNLQHWIREPQQVEPGTAMPDLGVSETDARDIAAYLFSLD